MDIKLHEFRSHIFLRYSWVNITRDRQQCDNFIQMGILPWAPKENFMREGHEHEEDLQSNGVLHVYGIKLIHEYLAAPGSLLSLLFFFFHIQERKNISLMYENGRSKTKNKEFTN